MIFWKIYRMALIHTCPNSIKTNVISNKHKLIRWFHKGYEDMGEEKDSQKKVKYLQDKLNFLTSFTDSNREHRYYAAKHSSSKGRQQKRH